MPKLEYLPDFICKNSIFYMSGKYYFCFLVIKYVMGCMKILKLIYFDRNKIAYTYPIVVIKNITIFSGRFIQLCKYLRSDNKIAW